MNQEYKKYTDQKLVKLASERDIEAFDVLIQRHQQYIMNLCMRYSSFHDAQDSFQKATLKAWNCIPKFRKDCSFKTWIYAIARSVSFDTLAKNNRRRESSFESIFRTNNDETNKESTLIDLVADKKERPDVIFEAADNNKNLGKQLDVALSCLSEEQVDSLKCIAGGMSYKEISKKQGVSINTVASRIFSARKIAQKKCAKILNYNKSV